MPAYSLPVHLSLSGRPARPLPRNNFIHHRPVRRIFSEAEESDAEPVENDVNEAEDAIVDSDVNMDDGDDACVGPVRHKLKVLRIEDDSRKRKAEYEDGPSKRVREDPEVQEDAAVGEDAAVEEALDVATPVRPRRIKTNRRLAEARAAEEMAHGRHLVATLQHQTAQTWAGVTILTYKATAPKTRVPGQYIQKLLHTLRHVEFTPVQRIQRKKGTTLAKRPTPKKLPQPTPTYGMTMFEATTLFRANRTARILAVRAYNARPDVYAAVQEARIRTEWFPLGKTLPTPADPVVFQAPTSTLVERPEHSTRIERINVTSVPRRPAPKPVQQQTVTQILAQSRRMARNERDRMHREMIDQHLAEPVRHVSNLHCNFDVEERQVEHLLPAAEIVSPVRHGRARRDSEVSILSEPPAYPSRTPTPRVPTPRTTRQPYLPNYRPSVPLPDFDDKAFESICCDVMTEAETIQWRLDKAREAAERDMQDEASVTAAEEQAIQDLLPIRHVQPVHHEPIHQQPVHQNPVQHQPVHHVQPVNHVQPTYQAPVAAPVHAPLHNNGIINNNDRGPVNHNNINDLAAAQLTAYGNNNDGFDAARELEEGPEEVGRLERAFEQVDYAQPAYQQASAPVEQTQEQAQATGIIDGLVSFVWGWFS